MTSILHAIAWLLVMAAMLALWVMLIGLSAAFLVWFILSWRSAPYPWRPR